MSFATDEEIRIAHNILLKDNKPFDNARMKIIKEDSSCYVQACPGSGKTTTLLAKLLFSPTGYRWQTVKVYAY